MRPARDWEILRKMRAGFLQAEKGLADYWESPAQIALYDAFYAGRIGWKWDAVLDEMTARGFIPPSETLVDWGCGSGVASRCFLQKFPQTKQISLWDRSALALQFASESLRTAFPTVRQTPFSPGPAPMEATFLLSHLVNELDDAALEKLLALLLKNAAAILWVEPGTTLASRRLIAIRERLRPFFSLIGPCPHQTVCGLLAPENARHWCHHFTRPPAWVHHDSEWSDFARELEIDLSTVPYSYLALSRIPVALPPDKMIGRPRFFKGHARILLCEASGVSEKMLQKRDDPARFKALLKA